MPNKLIIELAGLPGSGKTTIANLLIKTLKERRVECSGVSESARLRDVFFLEALWKKPPIFWILIEWIFYGCLFPILSIQLCAFALLIEPSSYKRPLLLISALVNYRLIKRIENMTKHRIFIFEELFLHNLYCSAAFGKIIAPKALLNHILKILYRRHNHIVFYLRVAPEVCVGRFLTREAPFSRFNKNTGKRIINHFQGRPNAYELLASAMAKIHPSGFFMINAEGPEKNVTEKVLAVLENLQIIPDHTSSSFAEGSAVLEKGYGPFSGRTGQNDR